MWDVTDCIPQLILRRSGFRLAVLILAAGRSLAPADAITAAMTNRSRRQIRRDKDSMQRTTSA